MAYLVATAGCICPSAAACTKMNALIQTAQVNDGQSKGVVFCSAVGEDPLASIL